MDNRIPRAPVLTLFVVVFGGILFVAMRDWLPGKSAARRMATGDVTVTAEKPFELEWPRRRDGVPAPHLSLRIPHTAFANGLGNDRVLLTRVAESGNIMYLFTSFPDPDGLSVHALGKGCTAAGKTDGCFVGELAVSVMQEMPDRSSPGYAVMESRERGSRDTETSGPQRQLDGFWVKEATRTGRLEFVGWDCEEPVDEVVSTDLAAPVAERNRCFMPPAEERRAPQKHGYQRLMGLTACAGDGTRCAVYFPFRGRHVEVLDIRAAKGLGAGERSRYAFLAAWEFLNRLRADAVSPPTAQVWLERARRSLENCRSISAMLPGRKRNEVSQFSGWQCRYAAHAAIAALPANPQEAGEILEEALADPGIQPGIPERMRQWAADARAAKSR